MSKGKSSVGPRHARGRPAGAHTGARTFWLYGLHAVSAALANPRRRSRKLLVTAEALESLRASGPAPSPKVVDRATIEAMLPAGAVHQGAALQVTPLPWVDLGEVLGHVSGPIVALDQVTDPHNVGAVLRSAAAFGAAAVIVTERHAPPETGALAKAASGALELVPLVRATNLVRTIEHLQGSGYWCLGLSANAEQRLDEVDFGPKSALILGSEGGGLRRLTRERCDLLVRLPARGPMPHLNVSNAAAVALYELARRT